MFEPLDSDYEDSSEVSDKGVEVQDIPPYEGTPVDIDTAYFVAMSLSPSDRITLAEMLYDSLEKSLLNELRQTPYMQLRFWQARVSFCLFVVSVSFSLTSCAAYTVLFLTGALPASLAVGGSFVTSASSAVSLYCYKFYRYANNGLDHAQSLYKV